MTDIILQCPTCRNPAVSLKSGKYQCLNPDCHQQFAYQSDYTYTSDKYRCGTCGQNRPGADKACYCTECRQRICPDCHALSRICKRCADKDGAKASTSKDFTRRWNAAYFGAGASSSAGKNTATAANRVRTSAEVIASIWAGIGRTFNIAGPVVVGCFKALFALVTALVRLVALVLAYLPFVAGFVFVATFILLANSDPELFMHSIFGEIFVGSIVVLILSFYVWRC